MNPYSTEMMKAYHAYLALSGMDDNCAEFICFAASLPDSSQVTPSATKSSAAADAISSSELEDAIVKGLRDRAAELTEKLLGSNDPLDIINGDVIPALNKVGKGFEEKKVFLPQLLMSAEAAKASFEVIKARVPSSASSKCRFVIATVKGDPIIANCLFPSKIQDKNGLNSEKGGLVIIISASSRRRHTSSE